VDAVISTVVGKSFFDEFSKCAKCAFLTYP